MELSVTEVIMKGEKYYPYTLKCPVCGECLRYVKSMRVVNCRYCEFSDVVTGKDEKKYFEVV
jgi:hypothetical protein